jgi:hypothetical protein
MPLMLMGVLAALLYTVLIEPALMDEELRPTGVALASNEVDRYKTFLYVASLFVQTQPGAGIFHWPQMMTKTPLPTALLSQPYSASWALVVQESGSWSTCTPLSEKSIGMLSQSITAAGLAITGVQSNHYMVLGQDLNAYKVCP